MTTSNTNLMHAFDRLVGRVLDAGCVPFLGAGISLSATIPEDSEFKPTVDWLVGQLERELNRVLPRGKSSLRERIKNLLKEKSETGTQKCEAETQRCQAATQKRQAANQRCDAGTQKCETGTQKCITSKLDQAADLLTWLSGSAHVCSVLRIDAFTRLVPLSAHRFCAYLAREGLVTEIITTNYDTCIEQAFRSSFGPNDEGRTSQRAAKALAVVFNLAQYRAEAGRTRSPFRDPVLHVYKINGDAEDFRRALEDHKRNPDQQRLEQRAARIIITERQLQTFRDELWARDLYADRARTRSLLFCGFGSDEPQVRHHAMALMEEMQRQARPVECWEDIARLPNAPFFAEYSEHLSFNQLQIMAGFAFAHARLGSPPDGERVLLAAHDNALTGSFASLLNPPDETKGTDPSAPKRLPADLLFASLFQAVWVRRVEEELEPGAALDNWLRSMIVEHRAWCDWLRMALRPERELPPSADPETAERARRALFGLASSLFQRDDMFERDYKPAILMQWLYAVRTGGEEVPTGADYYLSIREDPLFVLLTLLFCFWLTDLADPTVAQKGQTWITVAPGLGLRVRLSGTPERVVFLAREGVHARANDWKEPLPNLVWRIAIPGTSPVSEANPVPVIAGSPITSVRVVERSAAEIIRAARTPRELVGRTVAQCFRRLEEEAL